MRTLTDCLLRHPLLGFLLLASFLAAPQSARGIEPPTKPNFVYILMDDAGYGDLSCYGQQKFQTPNIDRLASRGLRFTQHYSGSTVCAPTRSVLMTGLHTGHTYVRGNKSVKPEGQTPLPRGLVTLPRLLSEAGYVCGGFGKWGLGPPSSDGDPIHQGFDRYYGYNCQAQAHNYYPDHLWDNLERVELDGKTYAHDLIMEQALAFIKQNRERPFFCFLPVTIPHAAMHVPESYSNPFRKKFPQFEDKIGKYKGPQVKNPIAAFAGMMTKLDEDVGRIVDLLAELELSENTLILLTSDNGPHKEGGHDPVFFDSNGVYRGHKRDLYEGGIRVPLIACWPGTIEAGRQSDHISAHWDVLPTICELAGIDQVPATDGLSMTPTLLGKGTQPQHEYLYWEFYEQGGKRAARFGDWKAVQRDLNKKNRQAIELYNLAADESEENNVAEQHPERVAQAKQIFRDAHTPSELFKFKFPLD